jgi:hypothetical protein
VARGAAAMRERGGGDFEGVRDLKLFFEFDSSCYDVTMKKEKKNEKKKEAHVIFRFFFINFFFNVSWHFFFKLKYDVACHVRYFYS